MRHFSPAPMRFIRHIHLRLMRLDWSIPLTRDEIRARIPEFPLYFYVRLPAAKRFISARTVMLTMLNAEARAEGEFLDEATSRTLHEAEVLADGGPPAWGADPLIAGEVNPGGSAMDVIRR
jgi:hypothetical protein